MRLTRVAGLILILLTTRTSGALATCRSFAFLASSEGGEPPYELIATTYVGLFDRLGSHVGPEELRSLGADPFEVPASNPKLDSLRKSLKEFKGMLNRPEWDGARIQERLLEARQSLGIRRQKSEQVLAVATKRARFDASVPFQKAKPTYAFSPDGRYLVVLDATRTVRGSEHLPGFTLVDLQTRESKQFKAPAFSNDTFYYGSVAFSEDGKAIVLLTNEDRIVTVPINGLNADLAGVKSKRLRLRGAGRWWDSGSPSQFLFTDTVVKSDWLQDHHETTRINRLTGERKHLPLPLGASKVVGNGFRKDIGEIPGTNGFYVRLFRKGTNGGIVRVLPPSRDLRKGEALEITTWTTLEEPIALSWKPNGIPLTIHQNEVWEWATPSGTRVLRFPENGPNGEKWSFRAQTVTAGSAAVLVSAADRRHFVYYAELATGKLVGPVPVSSQTTNIDFAGDGRHLVAEERNRLSVIPIEELEFRAGQLVSP